MFLFPGTRKTLQGTPLCALDEEGAAHRLDHGAQHLGVPRRFYVAIDSASNTSLNSAYTLSFRRQ